MKNKILLATGLTLSLGICSAASAVQFDINGVGGSDGNLIAFDWAPGNFLADNSTPIAPNHPFTGYYQAELTTLNFQGFDINAAIGADTTGGFEITAWMRLQEFVLNAVDADNDGFFETAFFSHRGGVFEIWYDDLTDNTGINADDFTGNSGTGYRDGHLIYSGNIRNETFGAFFLVEDLDPIILDDFGPNNLPGITTVDGQGTAEVATVALPGSYDPNFFLVPDKTRLFHDFNATLETPFNSVNPSVQLAINNVPFTITPDYGPDNINGDFASGTAVGSEDFHFEADANADWNHITIPEPSNIALLSLGLLSVGMRNKKLKNR